MGNQPTDSEPVRLPDQPSADSRAAAESTRRQRSPSAKKRRARSSRTDDSAAEGPDLAATYDNLREISRRTFATGHLAVAYHALAGALHAAQDLEDASRLEEVQFLAQEQMEAIDTGMPASSFSTQAAAHRGGEPLWATVARHAEMSRHLIRVRRPSEEASEWRQ